jgi:hypothetical protein
MMRKDSTCQALGGDKANAHNIQTPNDFGGIKDCRLSNLVNISLKHSLAGGLLTRVAATHTSQHGSIKSKSASSGTTHFGSFWIHHPPSSIVSSCSSQNPLRRSNNAYLVAGLPH